VVWVLSERNRAATRKHTMVRKNICLGPKHLFKVGRRGKKYTKYNKINK